MTDEIGSPTPEELGESFAALTGAAMWQPDAPQSGIDLQSASNEPPGPPRSSQPAREEVPPSPAQIIEALLFAGGPPLKPERAAEVIRGLTAEQFRDCVDELSRRYRIQDRPYSIVGGEQGYTLSVKPQFRRVREKLFGGPREARLAQATLDVLALVAYRQPVTRAEVDSLRGADSATQIRQLVRLGLIVVVQRGDPGQCDVAYGTTPRFLELFGLRSLDDLPRTGDTERI